MNPSANANSMYFAAPAAPKLADTGEPLRYPLGITWDVIPGTDSDGLWYGCRAALSIAHRHGVSARLFADPHLLAPLIPGLDANSSDQWWQGIHILAMDMLKSTPPGQLALAVFDAELPEAYLDRRRALGLGEKILRIARLAGTPHGAVAGRDRRGRLLQGEAPLGVGFVKPPSNVSDLKRALRESPIERAAALRRAGLGRDARPGERTILVSAQANSAWREWISVWRKSEVPVRVLVLDGPAIASLPETQMRPGREIVDGSLSITVLTRCNWALADQLLWLSDLVLTREEDIVMRAMASGTPVLYAAPESRADANGSASARVLGWQLLASPARATAAARGAMATLCIAWQFGRHVAQAWQRFAGVWDEVQLCVEGTGAWLRAMPSAMDTMVALAGESASAETLARQFAATVPDSVSAAWPRWDRRG